MEEDKKNNYCFLLLKSELVSYVSACQYKADCSNGEFYGHLFIKKAKDPQKEEEEGSKWTSKVGVVWYWNIIYNPYKTILDSLSSK